MTREDKILDHFASFIPKTINTESLKEMAMYDALCEVKALIAENATLKEKVRILTETVNIQHGLMMDSEQRGIAKGESENAALRQRVKEMEELIDELSRPGTISGNESIESTE